MIRSSQELRLNFNYDGCRTSLQPVISHIFATTKRPAITRTTSGNGHAGFLKVVGGARSASNPLWRHCPSTVSNRTGCLTPLGRRPADLQYWRRTASDAVSQDRVHVDSPHLLSTIVHGRPALVAPPVQSGSEYCGEGPTQPARMSLFALLPRNVLTGIAGKHPGTNRASCSRRCDPRAAARIYASRPLE